METSNNVLRETANKIISEIIEFRMGCQREDLLNEQWYIEFENFLNKVSVADPKDAIESVCE